MAETTLSREARGGGRILSRLRSGGSDIAAAGEPMGVISAATLDKINGRKSPFLRREQGGSDTTYDWQGREVSVKERTDNIPPELAKDFSDSLKGQLERLMDIQQDTPEVFDRLMNEPHHRPYRDLFDRYTKAKEGSATVGGHGMRVLDHESFDAYMNTRDGFITAYEMRTMKLQDMAIEAGIILDMNLPTPSPDVVPDQDVNTGRGKIGREVARRIGHFMGDTFKIHERDVPAGGIFRLKGQAVASVATLSAVYGGVGALAGPLGFAAGVAIPPALAGIVASFRRGERVTIEQAENALWLAQNADPVRREWAREMYNVDSANFEVVGGQVQIRQDIQDNHAIANPSKYAETVRDLIVKENIQIMKAQEAMGVARALRRGFDAVGIPGRQEQFAQRDMDFEITVQRDFLRSPQLMDHAGNQAQFEVPPGSGNWVDNPAFDWQNTDREMAWNLRREIHRNLLCEKIDRDFNDIAEWGKDHRGDLQAEIAERKSRYGKDGSLTKQRIDEIDRQIGETGEKKGALIIDGTILEGISGKFESFQTSLSTLGEKEIQRRQIGDRITQVPAAGGGPVRVDDLNVKTVINSILEPYAVGAAPPAEIIIDGVPIRSLYQRAVELDTRVASEMTIWQRSNRAPVRPAALPAGADKQAIAAFSAAQKQYGLDRTAWDTRREAYRASLYTRPAFKSISDGIDRDKAALDELITQINAQDVEIRTIRETLGRRTIDNAPRTETDTAIGELIAARTTVEGILGPGIWTGLNLGTQPIDVLLTRINQANQANPAVGWPEAVNREQTNREILLKAMAEARVVSTSADFTQAVDAQVWGLTEYDLFVLDTNGIRGLMNARLVRLPGAVVPNDATIDSIRQIAQDRFAERQAALTVLTEANQNRRRILGNEKIAISERGLECSELDTIERASSREGQINTAIMTMPVDQLVERLDIAPAADPALYLPAEAAHSIAYANIQQWIFDHRNNDNNEVRYGGNRGREAAYARNSSYLTPDVLRDLLTQWDNFPAGVAPATFDDAIDAVRIAIENHDISKPQFAEFLTENIIYGYMAPRVPVL